MESKARERIRRDDADVKFLNDHNLSIFVGNEVRDIHRRHLRRVQGRRRRRRRKSTFPSLHAVFTMIFVLVAAWHEYDSIILDDESFHRPQLNRTRPRVAVNCKSLNVTNIQGTKRIEVGTFSSAPRRMIAAFVFNDEFDMLRVHLDEMYDIVDTFVIAESTRTFQGEMKKLHLTNANMSWLEAVRSKIRIVVVDDMPACNKTLAWPCEYHQRNALARGLLREVKDDDIVIISDVDEIIRRDVATNLKFCDVPLPSVAETSFYYYSAHWKKRYNWNHPNIVRGQDIIQGITIEQIRQAVKRKGNQWVHRSRSMLRDAGWHFSYFMKVNEIVRKINSFSHTEYRSFAENPMQILSSVCTGTDLFSRDSSVENLDYVDRITDLPSCILESPLSWSRFTEYDPIRDPVCSSSNSLYFV